MEFVHTGYISRITVLLTLWLQVALVHSQNTVYIQTLDLSPSLGTINYQLQCNINNFQPAVNRALAWTKDGELISWDDMIQNMFKNDQITVREYVFESTTYYSLTILEVVTTHCGVYRCFIADGQPSGYVEVASAEANLLPGGTPMCSQPTTIPTTLSPVIEPHVAVPDAATQYPQQKISSSATKKQSPESATNFQNAEPNVTMVTIRQNDIDSDMMLIIIIIAASGGLVFSLIIVIIMACICSCRRKRTKAVITVDKKESDYDSEASWDSIEDDAMTRRSRVIYRASDSPSDPSQRQCEAESVYENTHSLLNVPDGRSTISAGSTLSPSLAYAMEYLNSPDDPMKDDDMSSVASKNYSNKSTDDRVLYSQSVTELDGPPNFDPAPPGTQGGNPVSESRLYDSVPQEH